MDAARYWMGVALVVSLPPALLWWFLVHPFVSHWRRLGPRTTLIVMGGLFVAGVGVLVPFRDALLVRDLGTGPVPLASAVVLVGISIWIAVQRKKHLTTRILAGVPELEPEGSGGTLLTEGIYGRIRHPRYVEIAIGTLGYGLFSGWLGAVVVAVVTIPALHAIVLLEERELMDRFGEAYERYRREVPRYVPRASSGSAGGSRS